jgi:hypothetical protein
MPLPSGVRWISPRVARRLAHRNRPRLDVLPTEVGACALLLPDALRARVGWGVYMPRLPSAALEAVEDPTVPPSDRAALAVTIALAGAGRAEVSELLHLSPDVLARVGRALSALAAGVPLPEWARRELRAGRR